MMIQVAIYVFLFIIPYCLLTFTSLDETYLSICVYMSLIGVTLMFFYEFMAMQVQGLKVYFSDPWNWVDTLTPIVYIALSVVNLSIANNSRANMHDLIESRRALNAFMLTTIWLKITWYQKL